MKNSRAALVSAGLAALALTGCPQFWAIFGPLDEEKVQIQQALIMQRAVMPSTNPSLGYLIRGIAEILSFGIPTFYGTDLGMYLSLAPWPPMPKLNQAIQAYPINDPSQPTELGRLQSADLRQLVYFTFNKGAAPTGKELTYLVSIDRAVEGILGKLDVTTRDTVSVKPESKPPAGQPHAPMTFGRKYRAPTPESISISANLSGRAQGNLTINLRKGTAPQINPELLSEISVSGSLPGVDFTLQGKVSPGGIGLSGDMGLTDAQGANRQVLQVEYLRTDDKALQFAANGIQQRLRIELKMDGDKLSGQVLSVNPDFQRVLGTVSSAGGQNQVKYIDRPQAEPWK